MSRRSVRAASALLLVLGVLSAGSRTAGADTCAYQDPFTPEVRQALAARWAGHHLTAEVYDVRTGCRFSYQPQLRNTTASVLKIEIMAGVLRRAQSQGRGLTTAERNLIHPMITQSADPPASQLWSSLGGISGMEALDQAFSMHHTTHASPWGLTRTSAHDQVELIRQVIFGQYGPLQASARNEARSFMLQVVPSQRWGITAGVPAGWAVPLKNGFFSSQCCRWRANTSGAVLDPAGGGYAITILSDGWPNLASGITAVEDVSRRVARRLTAPPVLTLSYGTPGDGPMLCDWNGDGVATPGVRRGRQVLLRNRPSSGPADVVFTYGLATDRTVCGDWDGDGRDSIGVVRGSTWLLRDRLSGGPAERIFSFGVPTDIAVPGDWNGDGRDSPGVVRGTSWLLRDSLSGGPAQRQLSYGVAGDVPVAGDWNGDGRDSPGVRRVGTWHLRNAVSSGPANVSIPFGRATDVPVPGDWNGDGVDTPGVRRAAQWFLRR
jgi:hypothetical protein